MARSNATTPEDVIGRVIAHAGPDEHTAASRRRRQGGREGVTAARALDEGAG